MILATPGFSFSLSLHEKVWLQPLNCVGSLKINHVFFKEIGKDTMTRHHVTRRCECFDLHNELVPYKQAWSWQKSVVGKRCTLVDRDDDHSDMLIVLQHPPVYTLGTGSLEKYLNFDIQNAPHDIYRTERGGEVTYHGPGQLVMYPILNLRYHKMDLHWYLRSLEEVVIRVLQSTFSIKASRLDDLTGVWVGHSEIEATKTWNKDEAQSGERGRSQGNQKVAAVGIRVSRWIAYHGLALNVTTDLTPFNHIVPCGIQNRGVGSLRELLGGPPYGITDADLIDATCKSLLKEFSEIFQLSLEHGSVSDLEVLAENSLSMFAEKRIKFGL